MSTTLHSNCNGGSQLPAISSNNLGFQTDELEGTTRSTESLVARTPNMLQTGKKINHV